MTPYVGEIRMVGFQFAPAGWACCDGQLIPIAENDTLFVVIGTTYGGDGEETFALPNLMGRVPIHQGTGSSGINHQLGEAAGTESVTLTVNNLPNHSHPMLALLDTANDPNPSNNMLARTASTSLYINDDSFDQMAVNAVQPVGGSQPHDNMMPYTVINFIISLYGLFPSPT